MNKLQLYIAKSGNNYKSLFNLNPDEDIRAHVKELRGALTILSYDSSEKNIIYLISYLSSGTFITIIRTIPPRVADHLAAWIYVPNGMDISAQDLENVVKVTTRKISNSNVSPEDLAQLRSLFSKEYNLYRNAPSMVASNSAGEFAVRYYEGSTGYKLSDFFGAHLYQPAYLNYSGVLLIDSEIGISADATDLTDEEIRDTVAIYPPEDNSSKFTPQIYGQPINRPFKVPMGEDIEVVWTRPGFEEVVQVVTIDRDGIVLECPDTEDVRKTITPASFLITGRDTRAKLTGCTIRVNGEEIPEEGCHFKQSALTNALITISCKGYMTFTGRRDLASATQTLITLNERSKVYSFELPVKSSDLGGPIRFEINCKHPLSDSPIDGYVLLDDIQEGDNKTNHLAFNRSLGASWLTKGIYAGIGLILGFIVCLGFKGCGNSDSKLSPAAPVDSTAQNTTAQNNEQSTSSTSNTAKPAVADEAAIKYLDSNKAWTKEDLEKHASLKGLYDDMNNLDLKKIVDIWGPYLSKSKTFSGIVAHAKGSLSCHKTPRPTQDGKFNKPDDTKITILNYQNCIDP